MNKKDGMMVMGVVACLLVIIVCLVVILNLVKKGDSSLSSEVGVTEESTLDSVIEEISTPETTAEETNTAAPEAVESIKEEMESVQESIVNENDSGDVTWVVGENPRFVNNDKFLSEVPEEFIQAVYSGVPNDYLEMYPDLMYISYIDNVIYGECSDRYHKFTIEASGDTRYFAILKSYEKDWPY